MRRHPKASTAGSTQRQAGGLGRFVRGAFAARDASLASKGSSAPSAKGVAVSLALLTALLFLAIGAASASAAVPTIPTTTVSAVTTKTAVLEADVNPQGEATAYHFEYGLADCSSNPCTSLPSGNLGSGSSAVRVKKEIEGLTPGTTYHFRAVASNGSGPATGPDRVLVTYEVPAATNCPNEVFRNGPAASLPDCRAYEMVSPVNKNGGDIIGVYDGMDLRAAYDQSALSGDKITYSSGTSFGDQLSSQTSNQYISSRGAGGWSTQGINTPIPAIRLYPFLSPYAQQAPFMGFTDDLSSAWMLSEAQIGPNALDGFMNIYRRDNVTNDFHAVTLGTPTSFSGEPALNLEFKGASDDGSHSVFHASAALTPDAFPGGERQAYESSGGALHLVSVLPDGTASEKGTVGATDVIFSSSHNRDNHSTHAVSNDGSRIFWTATENLVGDVYVRENPAQPQSAISGGECTEPDKACTIPVSESVALEQNAIFWAATPDGSRVLFEVLHSGLRDLYEFDVETETPTLRAADTQEVVATSDDLSYLYFVSTDVLAPGATAGQPNLYLDHEGAKTFIATVSASDQNSLAISSPIQRRSRATPDGRHLAFMSNLSLTGYDNTDAITGAADLEVFIYDADAQQLTCVSCNPSGARPIGDALRRPFPPGDDAAYRIPSRWTAAWIPSWERDLHASRVLSDDGSRLFFNSFDSLLPQDTTGVQDVYEWRAQGAGGCQKVDGCISLLSTGESLEPSEFVDASATGDDVFIRTSTSLVPHDPGSVDIYDARVNGGLPVPAVPPPCIGDICQSAPEASEDPTPASASFRGAGNPAPRKARRNCRARSPHAGQTKRQARSKASKRCKRAKRGAGR